MLETMVRINSWICCHLDELYEKHKMKFYRDVTKKMNKFHKKLFDSDFNSDSQQYDIKMKEKFCQYIIEKV